MGEYSQDMSSHSSRCSISCFLCGFGRSLFVIWSFPCLVILLVLARITASDQPINSIKHCLVYAGFVLSSMMLFLFHVLCVCFSCVRILPISQLLEFHCLLGNMLRLKKSLRGQGQLLNILSFCVVIFLYPTLALGFGCSI